MLEPMSSARTDALCLTLALMQVRMRVLATGGRKRGFP